MSKTDLPAPIRLTRPTAMDARDWRDMICEALNRCQVHTGEQFEIRAVARSTRPPIKIDDKRKRPKQDPDQDDENVPTTGELFANVVDDTPTPAEPTHQTTQ